jgi:hypothetical protein
MQKYRLLLAALGVLGALALAGCNDEGTSAFAGTATSSSSGATVAPTISSITLLESTPNLPSDDSKPVTITAIARDAANQLIPGAAIDFISSSGGILPVQTTAGSSGQTQVPAGTTDANGEAQAQVSTAGDPTNRTITVTATSGGASASISVSVVGTSLTLAGATSLVQNASSTYTVTLADSSGNGISNQTVTLKSALGNTLSASSVTTSALGSATFQVTASVSGSDTISASALGITGTQVVTVSAENFTFAAATTGTPALPTSSPPLNQIVNLTVNWTNSGMSQSGPVTFSTTRGLFTANGGVSYTTTITGGTTMVTISSDTAGPAVITATAPTGPTTSVTAQLPLTFIATVPASIDLQANPATIPVQGSSTITAIVRDANNNLVSNQIVNFQLNDVTNGSISVGSAPTNSEGKASTTYMASTTPSATNGVQITASMATQPALPAPPVPSQTVDLTVGGQALFLSLGTGSIIGENAAKTQFQLPYVVQAVDAGGNPVANVQLTMKIEDLPPNEAYGTGPTGFVDNASSASYAAYRKGAYVVSGSAWVGVPNAECLNEDFNGNGVLGDIFGTSIPEDLNGNGVLDPGGVATVSPSPVTTDATGTANITIYYPEDHAFWVQVKLTATATVAGTQTSTSAVFWLPILATYLTNTSASPPGYISPYGTGGYTEGQIAAQLPPPVGSGTGVIPVACTDPQ